MSRSALALSALGSCLLILVLHASGAHALSVGGQLVYGDDSDVGLGARLEIPTPELLDRTRMAADFNWYFPNDPPGADLTFWEVNLNWLHEVGDPNGEILYHVGGGLNFAYSSVDYDGGGDDSDSDLGVNFLGGAVLPLGAVSVVGEVRITVGGSQQFTLGTGLLF